MSRRNLKQIHKAGTYLLVILLVLSLSSCSNMFNGTQQLIPFNSQPQGAEVWIDGEYRGTTPFEVNLRRGVLQHEVLLKLGEFEQTVIVERAGMSRDATAGLVIETLPGGTLAFFGAVGLAGGCGGEIICEGLSLIVIPFGLLAVNLGYSAVAICADTNGASCKGYASCPGYTRALETQLWPQMMPLLHELYIRPTPSM